MSRLHQIAGCDNSNRRADVVFIHGLGGDAFATWCCDETTSNSWPYWLADAFPDVGVWSLGYAASPTKWPRFFSWFCKRLRDAGHSMSLPDRALQVLDRMIQVGLGERPLFFICHSLGGLLLKQILRTADEANGNTEAHRKRIATQTRAVLFLATPHAGAELASLIDAFREVFRASVSIEDLRAHEAHLRNLQNWYRRQSVNLGIETVTYFETRRIGGFLIVDYTSAHPGVGADPVPLDEDHLTIAKPRERNAQVCDAARDLLRRHGLAPRTPGPADPVAPTHSGKGKGRAKYPHVVRASCGLLVVSIAVVIGKGTCHVPRPGPYTNSLEMVFVPVAGTEVWFSIWETRVQDFEAFVLDSGYDCSASGKMRDNTS
jgi:hypothetical protein